MECTKILSSLQEMKNWTCRAVRYYPWLWSLWGNRRWSLLPSVLHACYLYCSSTSDELSAAALPNIFVCPIKTVGNVILHVHIRLTSLFILLFANIKFEKVIRLQKNICLHMFSQKFLAKFPKSPFFSLHSWDSVKLRASLVLCRWDWVFPTAYLSVSVRILVSPTRYRSEIWMLELELLALMLLKM